MDHSCIHQNLRLTSTVVVIDGLDHLSEEVYGCVSIYIAPTVNGTSDKSHGSSCAAIIKNAQKSDRRENIVNRPCKCALRCK